MAQHLIELWVEGDSDPEEVDWAGFAIEQGFQPFEGKVLIKTFPWSDVHHEVNWWITRPLTRDEWGRLDDAESQVLAEIVGEDNFQGTAGPIPGLGGIPNGEEVDD